MNTTKKNIIKNGLSSFGQKGVRVLEQLFLIPFFITHWGTAYYGEWLTLTIIPSVLAFSDLGLGSAASNSFVLKYASGKYQEAADVLKTGFVIITKVILIAMLIGAVGVGLALHFNWLAHSLIPTDEACYALLMMMMAKLLGFYMQLYEANFRAARKAHLGINLQTLSGCLNIGSGLLMLMLGYGVVGFALGQLLIAIFDNLVYGRIALRILDLGKQFKGVYNKTFSKEVFGLGLGYLMSPLWQSILFQGTTFVVRVTLGPTAVAMFNTVRTLSRSVNQLYSIINTSVFPEIQMEIGAGNVAKAKNILTKATKISGILALVGCIGMATIGLPIYNIWTKHELNPPYILWFLLVLATAVNAVWWTVGVVFRAMNKPYQLSISGVVFSLLAILITYVGCKNLGIIGAGIGALAFEIGMALFLFPRAFKLLNNKL